VEQTISPIVTFRSQVVVDIRFMKTRLTEEFTFEAAHRIRNKRKEYGELHGHTHKVYVTVSGDPDPEVGWLIDQQEFRGIVGRVVKRLDHRYLNEIMEQTTAESIALYLFKELEKNLSFNHLTLDSVKVCKTTTQAEVSAWK
jgi:6-pyruvoyltetrahydropterin/6-carboxytetrahydropterin synthase